MKRDEFKKERYEISFTAGMNQRYHQTVAQQWTRWNRAIQVSVGVLAVTGACLAVGALAWDYVWLDALAIIVASATAIVAVLLNVIPLGDWAQHHLDLFRRWTDLREDIDSLRFSLDDDPPPELADRLKSLAAKVHRIGALEPQPDASLLMQCYRDEDLSRRGADAVREEQQPVATGRFGVPGWG